MAYSIAYFKFKKSLEREIRNFWSISIAHQFSKEWLKQFEDDKRITQIAGNVSPYSYVDITVLDFTKQLPTVVEYSKENSLVNFITSFEVYIFESLTRMLYLNPNLLEKSDIKISTKEIVAGLKTGNFKQWFSTYFTDKSIRNNQHKDIIEKIAHFAKCDLKPINDEINEWNKWTYVRNSIVHNGRMISQDLQEEWGDKFSIVGAKIVIPGNELMKVQTIAMTIAKHLDNRINKTIVKDADAILLIRELFIRYGIDDRSHIKRILMKTLSYTAKSVQIDVALGLQRRTSSVITEVDFDAIIKDIDVTM